MTNKQGPLSFNAKVEKVVGEGGWHIVLLPPEILSQLRDEAGKNGNVPVMVTIGETTYSTTIMSMGQQRWFFAVNATVRKVEDISDGDEVLVSILPDFKKLGHL